MHYFFLELFFFVAGLAVALLAAGLVLDFFLAAFFVGLAEADFFLPLVNTASQASEYFFVVPTRTIVTADDPLQLAISKRESFGGRHVAFADPLWIPKCSARPIALKANSARQQLRSHAFVNDSLIYRVTRRDWSSDFRFFARR